MRSVVRRAATFATVGSLLVACSLSSSLDGLMGGDGDKPLVVTEGPDGGSARPSDPIPGPSFTQDGGGGAFVPEAGAPAPVAPGTNLHPYGSFDTSCDGWYASQSVVQLSSTAHTPPGSCQVCAATGAKGYYGINDYGVVANPPVGASYRATGWVRSAPNLAAGTQVSLMVRTFDASGGTFTQIEIAQSSVIGTVEATWEKLEATLDVTKPAPSLHVNFVATPSGAQCFLVDDVVLERVR